MNIHQLQGTIRARLPKDTLEIIKPYITKAGITRIANLTGLDDLGIPVFTCFRPDSKNLTTSQGKGLNEGLAQCSAYMEAIEHYFSENCRSHIQSKTISDMKGMNHIHFSELKSGSLAIKNADIFKFDWTAGKNLTDDKTYYLPTSYLRLDYINNELPSCIFNKNTTGLASGNNLAEAQCHALYEIIERNCFADFNLLKNTEKNKLLLDLDSIHFDLINNLIWQIQEKDNSILIFDITNKFSVPCYHCIIIDNNPFRRIGWHSGSGAHYSPEIAMSRAITEAAQSRLTFIAGSRDDILPIVYKKIKGDFSLKGELIYNKVENKCNDSFNVQLYKLMERLIYHGYKKIISVAHSSEEDTISIVRLVVPSLTI